MAVYSCHHVYLLQKYKKNIPTRKYFITFLPQPAFFNNRPHLEPAFFLFSFKPKFKAPNLLKSYVINTCHHSS